MADPQDTPQIEGLPPGAVVKPIAAAPQPQIEGLPPGAVVKPIASDPQSPEEVAARHVRAQSPGLRTNLPDDEDFMDKVRTGIGKRGLEIGQGAVGLVNKGLAAAQNMDLSGKVTPDTIQIPVPGAELETETKGVGETLGGLGTDVAALEAGGHVIKGFSTLLKLPEAALALAEKYPSISKHILSLASKATGTGAEIAEGAVKSGKPALETAAKVAELRPGLAGAVGTVGKTAALTGAQGSVEESAPGGQGPVAGAEQGALGGAAGATFAEVLGAGIKPLAKAVGLGTDDTDDLIRAVQGAKRDHALVDDWKTAAPRIREAVEEDGKFTDFAEDANRIGDIRKGVWGEVQDKLKPHLSEKLDTTNVASDVRALANDPVLKKRFPKDAKFLQDFADQYTSGSPLFSGETTVEEADKTIGKYNQKLSEAGYWSKSPKERAAMEANPEIAAWRAASDALRESLYNHPGLEGMAELKNLYGAVGHIEDAVRGQANVSARQRPISLKQMIGMAAGIAHGGPSGMFAAAVPIVDKLYNDPVALLNRALNKAQPGPIMGPVRKAAQKTASVVGVAAKETAPVAAGNSLRFTASDGSKHSTTSSWDKVKEADPGAKKD